MYKTCKCSTFLTHQILADNHYYVQIIQHGLTSLFQQATFSRISLAFPHLPFRCMRGAQVFSRRGDVCAFGANGFVTGAGSFAGNFPVAEQVGGLAAGHAPVPAPRAADNGCGAVGQLNVRASHRLSSGLRSRSVGDYARCRRRFSRP